MSDQTYDSIRLCPDCHLFHRPSEDHPPVLPPAEVDHAEAPPGWQYIEFIGGTIGGEHRLIRDPIPVGTLYTLLVPHEQVWRFDGTVFVLEQPPSPLLVVHIAGLPVHIGSRQRQRCAWCGAVIDDHDLSRIGFAIVPGEPTPTTLPEWPVGGLVVIDGNARYSIDYTEGAKLPDGCCGLLDPEVTA